jgi:hypothetical protein
VSLKKERGKVVLNGRERPSETEAESPVEESREDARGLELESNPVAEEGVVREVEELEKVEEGKGTIVYTERYVIEGLNRSLVFLLC